MNKTTSCIIPAYNEGERIFIVLDSLFKIDGLNEIIVVDDGSTDNIYLKLEEKYPNLKLLHFEKNHGKSGAIFEGLKIAQGENILLFDSDIFNINLKQLKEAILYFDNHLEFDMIILKRMRDPLFNRLIRTDLVTSGQRLLRSKDLKIISKASLKNFQLEMAINDYMIKENKNIGWLPLDCQDIRKVQKFGLIKGTYKEILMFFELISYKNFFYFFKILFSFCKKKINLES